MSLTPDRLAERDARMRAGELMSCYYGPYWLYSPQLQMVYRRHIVRILGEMQGVPVQPIVSQETMEQIETTSQEARRHKS